MGIEEGGENKERLEDLSDKQKLAFLHYLDLAELDIEEEAREGDTEEFEAEKDRAQIERIRERLLSKDAN